MEDDEHFYQPFAFVHTSLTFTSMCLNKWFIIQFVVQIEHENGVKMNQYYPLTQKT